MGKKKPTRIITPRIVQPGEGGGRPWLWLLFLLGLGVWTWQVFEFGRQRAGFDVGHWGEREQSMQQRIEDLEEERDELRAAAARFERAGQIDRAAAEGVQAEIKALQDERAELKREVALLESLVSGSKDTLTLSVFGLRTGDELNFQFEVTLSKRSESEDTVSGQVTVEVTGDLAGERHILDMNQLTDGSRSSIGIRFKSFQKLKADLQLPEGFEPDSLKVLVSPDDEKFKSFEQVYDWKVDGA